MINRKIVLTFLFIGLLIPSVYGISCQPVTKTIPVVVDTRVKVQIVAKDYIVLKCTTLMTTKNVIYTKATRYPNKYYKWWLYEDGKLIKSGRSKLQVGFYPTSIFLARAKGTKYIDLYPSNPNVLDPVRKYKFKVKFYPRLCTRGSQDAYYKLPQSDSTTKRVKVYP